MPHEYNSSGSAGGGGDARASRSSSSRSRSRSRKSLLTTAPLALAALWLNAVHPGHALVPVLRPTLSSNTNTRSFLRPAQAHAWPANEVERRAIIGIIATSVLAFSTAAKAAPFGPVADVVVQKEGREYKLIDVAGKKATLVVNVASQCALTPQYVDLEELYEKYRGEGLEILAFPCNQFGTQEPEPVEVVRRNMRQRFGVQFQIFDKIDVNGGDTHPLYKALKSYEPDLSGYSPKIAWNFEKFLLDSSGTPVRRYRPGTRAPQFEADVKALLENGSIPKKPRASLNDY